MPTFESPTLMQKENISPPDEEIYELNIVTDHELVKKYKPEFLGRGGEHIVYAIPGHPNVVAKVEVDTLKRIQNWNLEHGAAADASPDEIKDKIQEHLKSKKERHKQLIDYFGSEHVLNERNVFMKIPITEKILNQIRGDELPEKLNRINEAWAFIKIQKRAPELNDPTRLAVVGGYIENKHPKTEVYSRVTRNLIEHDQQANYSEQEFDTLNYPELPELIKQANQDESLKAKLKDFVEKAIRYSNETGEILDLASADNLPVFKKQDSTWSYRLVDALYPGVTRDNKQIAVTKTALLKAAGNEILEESEKNAVLNTINYVRVINSLAKNLGLETKITLVPNELKGKIDYAKILME